MAAEFISAHSDARIVRANCAVEGTPALTPIVELLRSRDIEADVPVGDPGAGAHRARPHRHGRRRRRFGRGDVLGIRRFAEILAAERPVIIVFDDIHWADSLLLDFIEHLAEWARGVPVLMIALARPELRETRPELVTVGGWVTEAVRLGGLEPSATAELAAQVLGSEQLPTGTAGPAAVVDRRQPTVRSRTRRDAGPRRRSGATPDGWRLTVDVDAIAIPPTIQALLASRLERLNAADRRVLEVASVVGTDFSPGAVVRLTGLGRAETKSALNRLRRLDLAQPSGTYSGDEPVWRFHHVLIRDVAYRRLLKSDRAELHERLADWVKAGGARPAFDPTRWSRDTWKRPTATGATSGCATSTPRNSRCVPHGTIWRQPGAPLIATNWCRQAPRRLAARRSRPAMPPCRRSCCSWDVRRSCPPAMWPPAHRWSTSSNISPESRWRRGRSATDVS